MAAPGSTLTVLSQEKPSELSSLSLRKNVKIRHVKGDASDPEALSKLHLAKADSVLVLQRGEGGEAGNGGDAKGSSSSSFLAAVRFFGIFWADMLELLLHRETACGAAPKPLRYTSAMC